MRLLARLFLLVLGLVIAIPLGLAAMAIGIALEPTARELVGTLGFATLWQILADLAAGDLPDERTGAVAGAVYWLVAGRSAGPARSHAAPR